MRIMSLGMAHPGPCGVRDHGLLLAKELRASGDEVQEVWISSDGRGLRQTLGAGWKLLRAAFAKPPSRAALWHYSVFAYSFHGIPMPGILLGLLMKLRGVHVVAILHEMAMPLDTPGRRKVQALCQQMALPLVLMGANEIVVTTEARAVWLRSRFRVSRARLHVVPVFSNFGERRDRERAILPRHRPEGSAVVAVPGWASSPGLESILVGAITEPELSSRALTVELIGAPGPDSAAARRWLSIAKAAGIADRLHFTGVLRPEDFTQHLSRCDVTVLLCGDGPSTRHTMLAAAMAHGCAIIALDGPDTWLPLVERSAVSIAKPTDRDLARTLVQVLDDPEYRKALGIRALTLYDGEMSLATAARTFRSILDRKRGLRDQRLSTRRSSPI